MELEQFIAQRKNRWDRLEKLLATAEASAAAELGRERLLELVRLYRQACSDLNQARSFTANPEILDRLNQLTGRGYRFIYREEAHGATLQEIKRFCLTTVPATFQQERVHVLVAAGALLLGTLVGFSAVLVDPATARDLTPGQFYTERPRQRVEQIERSPERISGAAEAAHLSAQLYTNNIRVSFLAFALGALTILCGIYYLFWTGTWLGAIAATYFLDSVHVFFVAWVGPHGALELPAIVFAGAAGLRAGQALLLPGDLTRAASLRRAFPVIWRMMLATAGILVVAGVVEGSFSQFSAKTVPYAIKIGFAVVLFASLLVYLFFRQPSGERGRS